MPDRYYIGARYVPTVYEGPDGTNTWLPGVAYDGLVIVTYGTYSYMSKKPVPAGLDPPDINTAYWIKAAVYNADVENVRELLDTKADKDGMYPELYAGGIFTDETLQTNTPYISRDTGGGQSNISPVSYLTLIGASVAENQLVKLTAGTSSDNGVTYTRNTEGTVELSGTATGNSLLNVTAIIRSTPGHKLLVIGCPTGGSSETYYGREGFTAAPARRDFGNGNIVSVVSSGNVIYQICITAGYDTTGLIFKPQLIDLTLLLGSAIADYIYNLETATAGSGMAWLRKYGFITDDYRPYNAGTIESVEATAKVVRDANGENTITYALGEDVLRGIFKLDASNNLYADGDRKEADGTITRYFGEREYQEGDETLTDAITDGTTTVYKLTTPTTETSTPFTSPQICYPDGTEEFITENGVPVGNITEYMYDLTGVLNELADVPAADGTYVFKAIRAGSNITYEWTQEV